MIGGAQSVSGKRASAENARRAFALKTGTCGVKALP